MRLGSRCRPVFRGTYLADWNAVLKEIQTEQLKGQRIALGAQDSVRRRHLKKLHARTGRNVISYYSGFLSKPNVADTGITDEDKNGLMMAVHKLDRSKGLDLLLHTPGGAIAVTESMVDYLRKMFDKDIRAIVPQIAMSAGTMIACACKEIVMGTHSSLGPIDPQLQGVPCAGVIEEFKRAHIEIKNDNTRLAVWHPILSKYPPSWLMQCENAVNWAKDFAKRSLIGNMLANDSNSVAMADTIVTYLTDFTGNRAHDRHIDMEECQRIGLKVTSLEKDCGAEMQDLVLSVHHSYMHAFANSLAFKVIENHKGAAFVKQQALTPGAIGMPIPTS